MRLLLRVLALACLGTAAFAQTYNPKSLRFEGVPAGDREQLLQLTGLTPGAPVTKEQIEAALRKLADSGAYDDLSYSVGPDALVIKLKPLAGNDALPVRYANFVWWEPKALEQMVEARVPGFHGELQLHSAMTKDVVRALEDIMKEKGIPAMANATEDLMHQVVALSLTMPSVLFGELKLSEEFNGGMAGSTAKLEHAMKNSEFSAIDTPETIVADLKKIFSGGGYLDVVVEPPVFTAPHASGPNYIVDGSATIHRGEPYRVASVNFVGAPEGTESALRKDANVKAGGMASSVAARLNNSDLEGELATLGYLAAKSTESSAKDTATHTVSYSFKITPGALYHLTSIDTSRATPDIQAAIARDKRLQPGVVVDHHVSEAISEDILKFDPKRQEHLSTNIHPNFESGTATIVLVPVALPTGNGKPVHLDD